jgi:hypothetical protein
MHWMYKIGATVGHLGCKIGLRGVEMGRRAVCARTACEVSGKGVGCGVAGGPCPVKMHSGGYIIVRWGRNVIAVVQLWSRTRHGRVGDYCLEARQQSDEDEVDHCDVCV